VRVPPALTFFRSWMTENVRKTGVREVFADQHGGTSTRFGMSMAMDADDEEVDAAASSVGALHMNPFRSNGGAELARAPWSRQQYRQKTQRLKNLLSAGISQNTVVLLLWLCFVLLSHHQQHLNPARPLPEISVSTFAPADGQPSIPWRTPHAGMNVLCGEFSKPNPRRGMKFTTTAHSF